MSCCGKKREELRQRRTISVLPVPASPEPTHPRAPVVFKGVGAYLVTGVYSRDVYRFSQEQPEQWIDARDAAALIATGLFEAKGRE
jgi:hypothetical protein